MKVVNHPKVAVLRLSVLVLVCMAYLSSRIISNAQQQPGFQQPAVSNPVQWLSGPRKVDLGDTAEINVPESYQFLDEKGSRYFLEGKRNVAPKNLVGILAPSSGRWFAVIKYSEVGYVKDTDASQIDAAGMLKTIRQMIAPASAEWELQPAYNRSQNTLEWAVRAMTQGNVATVNYTVRLFGRRAVLEVVAIQPYQADFDLTPMREIVKGISFKQGERYADFQSGDKLAKTSMAQLAAGENNGSAAAKGGHKLLWIGAGVAVLLVAGAVILLVRNFSQGRRSLYSQVKPVAATASASRQPGLASAAPNTGQPASALATSAASAVASATVESAKQPAPASQRNTSERNGKNVKHNGRRRKKQYNFHLFYSDMIMNLTRWNYLGNFGSYASDYAYGVNGSMSDQLADGGNGSAGKGNGTGANHSNGANGHPVSTPGGALTSDAARVLAMETSKLIENQQKLIEGQRKLIDEQNKLIQEKSKLIDFEQTVLEKPSELLEEQGLL